MNANELADLLLDFDVFHTSYKHLGITETESLFVKAATMLRQQQAEIEALKAKDLKKSMAIRSLNTQLKKALQYETFNR